MRFDFHELRKAQVIGNRRVTKVEKTKPYDRTMGEVRFNESQAPPKWRLFVLDP